MLKVVVLIVMFFFNLQAESDCDSQKCCDQSKSSDNSIGVIVSGGEGTGVLYRINFEDSYLQNAGYIYLEKHHDYEYFNSSYALSYGKYIYSSNQREKHLKILGGVEGNYEKSTDVGNTRISKNIITTLGAGFEWGKRERGAIAYGVDALYVFDYSSGSNYSLHPALAIYAHYNY